MTDVVASLAVPSIYLRNCTLRPLTLSDAPALTSGLNQDIIGRDTMIQQPWTLELARWWIGHTHKALLLRPVREVHFAIDVKGELVGSVAVMNIQEHKSEIGYWLKESYHRQGIMSAALAEVIAFSEEQLNLQRLFAPILTHNTASQMLLKKQGFVQESLLKGYYKKNGKLCDAFGYVRLKTNMTPNT